MTAAEYRGDHVVHHGTLSDDAAADLFGNLLAGDGELGEEFEVAGGGGGHFCGA
ncbi:hypothetical protein D3C83_192950 [compost metagenome]